MYLSNTSVSPTSEVDHLAGGLDALPDDEVDHDPGQQQGQHQPPLGNAHVVYPGTDAQDVVSERRGGTYTIPDYKQSLNADTAGA